MLIYKRIFPHACTWLLYGVYASTKYGKLTFCSLKWKLFIRTKRDNNR